MTDAELADLLRLVLARPDDHDVLRVYADALIDRGELRGELITVQLERSGDAAALADREHELTARLDATLATQLGLPATSFAWSRGFIDRVDFSPSGERQQLADALRKLGTLPEARRLRRIVVRFVEPGWGSMGPAIATLVKIAPQLRWLRELVFTLSPRDERGEPRPPSHFGDLSALWRAIPKLEVLEIGGMDFSTLQLLDAPSLRRLVLERPIYDVPRLAHWRLPGLEELEIHGDGWTADALVGLLRRELPLHHLVLTSPSRDTIASLAREVPASRVFRGVRTFGLGGTPLDDDCLAALARHAPRLRQLARFEVTPTPHYERLRELLGDIVVER